MNSSSIDDKIQGDADEKYQDISDLKFDTITLSNSLSVSFQEQESKRKEVYVDDNIKESEAFNQEIEKKLEDLKDSDDEIDEDIIADSMEIEEQSWVKSINSDEIDEDYFRHFLDNNSSYEKDDTNDSKHKERRESLDSWDIKDVLECLSQEDSQEEDCQEHWNKLKKVKKGLYMGPNRKI